MPHWMIAIHLLKYLKGVPAKGLFFMAKTVALYEHTQMQIGQIALWLANLLLGTVFFLVQLSSLENKNKQTTISRFSAEAKYRSMASMVCELQWISYLLKDLHVPLSLPIPLHYDGNNTYIQKFNLSRMHQAYQDRRSCGWITSWSKFHPYHSCTCICQTLVGRSFYQASSLSLILPIFV